MPLEPPESPISRYSSQYTSKQTRSRARWRMDVQASSSAETQPSCPLRSIRGVRLAAKHKAVPVDVRKEQTTTPCARPTKIQRAASSRPPSRPRVEAAGGDRAQLWFGPSASGMWAPGELSTSQADDSDIVSTTSRLESWPDRLSHLPISAIAKHLRDRPTLSCN